MSDENSKSIPKWPDSLPPPTELILLPPEHVLCRSELVKNEDIQNLIHDLFFFPEEKYFLYFEYASNDIPDGFDANRLEQHGLSLRKYENFYYRRPDDKDQSEPYSFIRLAVTDIQFPWQQEIVNQGPMYGRVQIELKEWKKKEIELSRIQALNEQDDNPLVLQPNFWGLGIDLKKIPSWVKRIFSKKRT